MSGAWNDNFGTTTTTSCGCSSSRPAAASRSPARGRALRPRGRPPPLPAAQRRGGHRRGRGDRSDERSQRAQRPARPDARRHLRHRRRARRRAAAPGRRRARPARARDPRRARAARRRRGEQRAGRRDGLGAARLIARATDELVRAAAHDEEDLALPARPRRPLDGHRAAARPRRRRSARWRCIVTGDSRAALRRRRPATSPRCSAAASRSRSTTPGCSPSSSRSRPSRRAALGTPRRGGHRPGRRRPARLRQRRRRAQLLGFASPDELLAAPRRAARRRRSTSSHEDGSPLRPRRAARPPRARAASTPEPLLVRDRPPRDGRGALAADQGDARCATPRARRGLAVNVIEDITEVKRAELRPALARRGRATLLASSLDYEETLQRRSRELAVPGARRLVRRRRMPDERRLLRSVAVAHVDPGQGRASRASYNARYPTPVRQRRRRPPQVMRDGRSQLVNEIPRRAARAGRRATRAARALRALGMRAVHDRPDGRRRAASIGAITLVTPSRAARSPQADLELAEELGRRAGTAVENARLYTRALARSRARCSAACCPAALPDIPGFALAVAVPPGGRGELASAATSTTRSRPRGGWMVVVGDVAGRGAEAAALTAQARHTLRTAARLLGDPRGGARAAQPRRSRERDELSLVHGACVVLLARARPRRDGDDRAAPATRCRCSSATATVEPGRARAGRWSAPGRTRPGRPRRVDARARRPARALHRRRDRRASAPTTASATTRLRATLRGRADARRTRSPRIARRARGVRARPAGRRHGAARASSAPRAQRRRAPPVPVHSERWTAVAEPTQRRAAAQRGRRRSPATPG